MYFLSPIVTDIYNSKKGSYFKLWIAVLWLDKIYYTWSILLSSICSLFVFVFMFFSLYLVEVAVKPDAKATIASSYSQLTGGASYEHLVFREALVLLYFKKESSCNRLIASTYQEVVLKMAMKDMFAEQHHANSWLSRCGITKVSFWGRHCFDRRHWPKASTSPSWMIITIIQMSSTWLSPAQE